MKKVFLMKEIDCANCAAKMENAINKIEGVTSAKVSFMAQKLILEAPEEVFERVLEESRKVVRKIESGCEIVSAK